MSKRTREYSERELRLNEKELMLNQKELELIDQNNNMIIFNNDLINRTTLLDHREDIISIQEMILNEAMEEVILDDKEYIIRRTFLDESGGESSESTESTESHERQETLVEKEMRIYEEQIKGIESVPIENLCKVCMMKERDTLFMSCRHVVTCKECAIRLNECPVCRKRIFGKKKLFLS